MRLPGAKTKNLFLRDKKGLRHFLVTVAHDSLVDLNALWAAPAVQTYPLVNAATLILVRADPERFLAATGHSPRIIDVPSAPAARGGEVNA